MSYRAGAAEQTEPVLESVPPPSCTRQVAALTDPPPPGARRGREREDDPGGATLEFEELYESWFNDVSRWVRALGALPGDREDLVQDVFVIAYRRLPDFDGRNPAGWLYRIARRRVRDYRRLRWFKYLVKGRGTLPEGLPHGDATPSDRLEQKQTRDLLERLLDGLNPEQRAAFVLFEVEGCSGQEIATVQGVPLNTVWARIHSARKKLKNQLNRGARFGKEHSP